MPGSFSEEKEGGKTSSSFELRILDVKKIWRERKSLLFTREEEKKRVFLKASRLAATKRKKKTNRRTNRYLSGERRSRPPSCWSLCPSIQLKGGGEGTVAFSNS